MLELKEGLTIPNGYQLAKKIGVGGFGEVWRAVDMYLNDTVALKFARPDLVSVAETDRMVIEEGANIRRLATCGHPGSQHIVRVNRAVPGSPELPAFLDLQWMDGGNLDRMMPARGVGMPQEQILTIAGQIAKALDCAHQQKIIHCDIKPSNVLQDDMGNYRLADFGLSRRLGQLQKGVMGTWAYMSPEQFTDPDRITPRSDIYNVGVLMYRMAAGRVPFEGDKPKDFELMHLREKPRPIDNPLLTEDLLILIEHCLSKSPDGRPDAAALVNRIRAIGGGSPDGTPRGPQGHYLEARPGVSGAPRIEHKLTRAEFVPLRGNGEIHGHVIARPLTHGDFHLFINDRKSEGNSRWRPASVTMAEQDGGYLDCWLSDRPSEAIRAEPVTNLTYHAAAEFALWMGGSLPSLAQAEALFLGGEMGEVADAYVQYMESKRLPCLCFWCQDSVEGDRRGQRHLWRLVAQSARIKEGMGVIVRPGHFSLPHYLPLVVISRQFAERILTNPFGEGWRPSAEEGHRFGHGGRTASGMQDET